VIGLTPRNAKSLQPRCPWVVCGFAFLVSLSISNYHSACRTQFSTHHILRQINANILEPQETQNAGNKAIMPSVPQPVSPSRKPQPPRLASYLSLDGLPMHELTIVRKQDRINHTKPTGSQILPEHIMRIKQTRSARLHNAQWKKVGASSSA